MQQPAAYLLADMEFPERLATLRKERGLTQQALADLVGVHVSQLRRYEANKSQPTIYILRRVAQALGVSADLLLFDRDDQPPDDKLRQQMEAIFRLDDAEKEIIRSVIEGILLKHEVKRIAALGSLTG